MFNHDLAQLDDVLVLNVSVYTRDQKEVVVEGEAKSSSLLAIAAWPL